MDSAVAGEAAAIAIGLVMLGTGSERAISDLLAYGSSHCSLCNLFPWQGAQTTPT